MAFQAASYPSANTSFNLSLGSSGLVSEAAGASGGHTGNSSISHLVQALQKGAISKQQLYSSLTHIYKDGQQATNAGLSSSLLGSPVTINSSFDPSFSLLQSASATPAQPLSQQFAATQLAPLQPPPQPQSHPLSSAFQTFQQPTLLQQQQQQQQQQHPHTFPSFAAPPSHPPSQLQPAPAQAYSSQAQAAQQRIQSFLAKHLNQSNASLLNQSDSLDLSLGQSGADLDLTQPANRSSSLNLSSQLTSINQSHLQPFATNQVAQPFFSPVQHGGGFQQGVDGPTFGILGMDDSLAMHPPTHAPPQQAFADTYQKQPSHPQPYATADEAGEAEEYMGDGGGYYESIAASSTTSRGGGGGGGGPRVPARQSVRERMTQVYTDEVNKELTFKPNITPMPRGLYAKAAANEAPAAPFLGRVMHWSENKRARERQRGVELERKALAECSFKPQLSAESIAIVEAPGASHRRLFSARSTARAKILELEVRRKEEEAFRANCTFEPTLNRKSLALANASQRRPLTAQQPPSPAQERSQSLGISSSERELAECTFAPRVNAVPDRMVAANLYLEQNAFERLASTKPRAKAKEDEDGYASDGANAKETARGRGRSATGGASARSSSTSARRSSSQDPRSSREQSQDSFNEFLGRLKLKEYQRTERLAALRADEERQHQYGRPMLSKKSLRMVQKSIENGSYMSPAKHAQATASMQRAQNEPDGQLVAASASSGGGASEFTFAPRISPYSSSLQGRTFHEMSALELVRRAHNLELAAAERHAAEMEQASFQPKLNTGRAAAADSRLKVRSEPDMYLERLEFQRKLREAEVERAKQERIDQEMAACTFTPATHEAPKFVQRIARSMEQTRALEAQAQQAALKKKAHEKPEWK